MTKTYIDMDGVLANFDKEQNALERFTKEVGFFSNLEPLPYAKAVNQALATDNELRENTYILSASPNERADIEKVMWLSFHLPHIKPENIIIVRGGGERPAGELKAEYCQKGDVLIDDYSGNLLEWQKKGGLGVKMTNKKSQGKKWNGVRLDYNSIL